MDQVLGRYKPPESTVLFELGPTGLRLASGRRIHFSEIAIVSDDSTLLLADGEELALARAAKPSEQKHLADMIREAHQRSARGTTQDVPAALIAARAGAKVSGTD